MTHQGPILKNQKNLISYGDSWTFGAELIEPEYDVKNLGYPLDATNVQFRIDNVFPTLLAKKMNFDNCVNYGVCGGGNDSIFQKVIHFVYDYVVEKQYSADDLFIIIGLTTPLRKDFFIEGKITPVTITAQFNQDLRHIEGYREFWEFYVSNFMVKLEYVNRYVEQVLYMENLLKQHNIKFLMFQSIYDEVRGDIDDNIKLLKNDENNIHNLYRFIDSKTFYGIEKNVTFNQFLRDKNDKSLFAPGFHPTASGHELWADEMYNYILNNKLI